MSFEAAVGRIDQILQLQQSLLDPASLMAGSSAASTPASATAGASTNFASALATAQGLTGTSPTASTLPTTTTGGVSADGSSNPQVQAMVNEADSLVGKPYVYGGGHSGWGPQAGYDCSGFVSAVLHAGGYLSSPRTRSGFRASRA